MARPWDCLWWFRKHKKWRWSARAALALSLYVLIVLGLMVTLVVLDFTHWEGIGDGWVVARVCVLLLRSIITAILSWAYIHVGWKAKRSYQLHLHGLALLIIHTTASMILASQIMYDAQETCVGGALLLSLIFVLWAVWKGTIFMMMREKMMALGSVTVCRVSAAQWAQALALSSVMTGLAGAGVYTYGVGHVFFAGLTCEEMVAAASAKTFTTDAGLASKIIVFLLLGITALATVGVFVAGSGTLHAANRLRRTAVMKLVKRQVDGELLAKVQRTLGQHFLGMFCSIASVQLGFLCTYADSLNLLGAGHESQEDFMYVVGAFFDCIGDIAGILLLSGLGILLVREDPQAGDISSHIRGVLHSAVLTGRAEMVFEGRVTSEVRSGLCVASFPGKFLADWNALTWACEQGEICSACVFLPQADPERRFGMHAPAPMTPGKCWCHSIYGEEKVWGCQWWQAWSDNIDRAVELNLELVAVFFPGAVGKGIVEWADLGTSDLWDGVGLGGSQKSEVAYLRMRGLRVTEVDVEAFRRRVHGLNSQPTPGAT